MADDSTVSKYCCNAPQQSLSRERKLQDCLSTVSIPDKSIREHSQSILQYVRLATLSHEEIIKEVMPVKILSPNEGLELLTAIASNQPWEVSGFCSTHESRDLSNNTAESQNSNNSKTFKEFVPCVTSKESIVELTDYNSKSVFTIYTLKDIEMIGVTIKSNSIIKNGLSPTYKLNCSVTVCKIKEGYVKETLLLQVGGHVLCQKEISLPLKLRNGQYLKLEDHSFYVFTLEFSFPHSVYSIKYSSFDYTNKCRLAGGNMEVTFETPIHVRKITYNIF